MFGTIPKRVGPNRYYAENGNSMSNTHPYTCADYREEMILLGLRRRLEDPDVPEEEKPVIQARIQALEISLKM